MSIGIAQRKVAFLIGVSDYGGINDLPYVKKDIELMSEVLSRKGFLINPRLDMPLRELIDKGSIKNAADENDVIFIYFSGHGNEVFGEQLLVGKNAVLTDLEKAFNSDPDVIVLSRLLHEIKDSAALKIVVVDCCRNPVSTENMLPTAKEITDSRRTTLQSIQNCIVAFSSADGETSVGDADGSYFTRELADEMQRYKTDFVHMLQAALQRLRVHPRGQSQTPWMYASASYSLISDQFAFIEEKLGDSFQYVKYADNSGSGAIGILGQQKIVEYVAGIHWRAVANIKKGKKFTNIALSRSATRVALIRDKIISLPVVLPPPKNSSIPDIEFVEYAVKGFSRVFGAEFSPCRELLAIYGAAKENSKSGLLLWRIDSAGKRRPIKIDGLVEEQCNAVQWTNDGNLTASFSTSRGKSCLVKYNISEHGGISACSIAPISERVTAVLLSDSKEWFGTESGKILCYDASGDVREIQRATPFPLEGKRWGRKGWVGEGDSFIGGSPAVQKMIMLAKLDVLAIRYYDGSIACLDTIFYKFIVDFPSDEYFRESAFCLLDEESIFTIRGVRQSRIVKTLS